MFNRHMFLIQYCRQWPHQTGIQAGYTLYTGRLYTIQAGTSKYTHYTGHHFVRRLTQKMCTVYCVVCIVEHALQSWVHVTAGATIWHLKSYHYILYRNCFLTSRRKLFKYFSLSQEPSYVITLSCWRLSQHKQIVARPALL